MSIRTQRLCVWAGPLMMVFWMIGFAGFAGFVPPPSPQSSAEQIAAMFREHTTAIRFGLLLSVIGTPLLAPFFTVIFVQMKRIEGRHTPLAHIQLTLGGLLVLAFYFPLMILQTAAYRPDRPAETILALDDLGWMMFVGVVTITVLQLICIGAAIFGDKRADPVFPRWSAYFNIWVGILFFPGSLILFFKDGPLAWNGVFTWWVPLSAFAIWLVGMAALLLKAIAQQAREEAARPATTAPDTDDTRARLEQLTTVVADLQEQLGRTTPPIR